MFDPTETDILLALVRREMHRCRRMMYGVSRRDWEIKYVKLALIETTLEFSHTISKKKEPPA
jgi:hypothetical protein